MRKRRERKLEKRCEGGREEEESREIERRWEEMQVEKYRKRGGEKASRKSNYKVRKLIKYMEAGW